ncbi:hypothetical protein M406DRAFT_47368 [Cryphonectria parasitica EP155]|uniref:F-box domain-containing protein n=1 Tax=Cryphonectria parasitica (strain ATCC 38755 / EP155) TaxID=660469 RepID=A0A9P5CIQ1_CRYP1|nr:uncharacterized protein M406DRAFT_47368 [Cryphonectria parasitica EP155]KAF3760864.1 hypothetical protein M406DRAFT_47368 [Cryphonectria parasitica EP155]
MNPKGFTPRSRQNSGVFTREDHMAMARSMHHGRRPPQRSRTTHENIPSGPQVLTFTMAPPQARYQTPAAPAPAPTSDSVAPLPSGRPAQPRRPKLGPPRRSYSVMDYEPVPPEQRPASGPLTLTTLPPELHFAIFDHLDPIDATCLGLTSSHFYSIHRRMHGPVPLSVRRDGPNELEWAWHRAAYPTPSMSLCPNAATTGSLGLENAKAGHLAALRVRGKGLCRKCGTSRCELHKHIVEWMPADYEYCAVRDKFVPRPGEEAKAQCYMSNPTNTTRCGRHRIRRDKTPTS